MGDNQPIQVQWIKWGERTMTLRGTTWYTPEPHTFVIRYEHVSAACLAFVDESTQMHVAVPNAFFVMVFQSDTEARDAMGMLSAKMEKA